MRNSVRRHLITLTLLGTLAGCGNGRTPAPDVSSPALPNGAQIQRFPALGVEFRTASNWTFAAGEPPLVGTTTSGTAELAIWRYPRSETLPRTLTQLRRARHALVAAARTRDASFRAQAGVITRIDGQPAIELLGTETVSGQPREVHSTHVYAYGAEYVIDAFAPASVFAVVDGRVTLPLLASLQLVAPAGASVP